MQIMRSTATGPSAPTARAQSTGGVSPTSSMTLTSTPARSVKDSISDTSSVGDASTAVGTHASTDQESSSPIWGANYFSEDFSSEQDIGDAGKEPVNEPDNHPDNGRHSEEPLFAGGTSDIEPDNDHFTLGTLLRSPSRSSSSQDTQYTLGSGSVISLHVSPPRHKRSPQPSSPAPAVQHPTPGQRGRTKVTRGNKRAREEGSPGRVVEEQPAIVEQQPPPPDAMDIDAVNNADISDIAMCAFDLTNPEVLDWIKRILVYLFQRKMWGGSGDFMLFVASWSGALLAYGFREESVSHTCWCETGINKY